MPARMGIEKALSIVSKFDEEQLSAIEAVFMHYTADKPVSIFTGIRIMKKIDNDARS